MNAFLYILSFLAAVSIGWDSIDGSSHYYYERAYQLPETTNSVAYTEADETQLDLQYATHDEQVVPAPSLEEEDTTPVSQPEPETEASPVESPSTITQVVEEVAALPSAVLEEVREATQTIFKLPTTGEVPAQAVFELTNQARQKERLPAFRLDQTLSEMAELKIDDMLRNEYFDHDSPQGKGISDFADAAGYEYLLVGENLAYGNFRDAAHVVEAWLDSPGHRRNILHEQYLEIGIASRFVTFDGQKVWMVVQEFGVPRAVCQAVDTDLRVEIESRSETIAETDQALRDIQDTLQNLSPYSDAYATLVNEFNSLLDEYNALIKAQQADVKEYNSGVQAYNACLTNFES